MSSLIPRSRWPWRTSASPLPGRSLGAQTAHALWQPRRGWVAQISYAGAGSRPWTYAARCLGLWTLLLGLCLSVPASMAAQGTRGRDKVEKLSPAERAWLKKESKALRALPPEEQQRVRKNLRRWTQLPEEQRTKLRERWHKWQQLPPEQRQRLEQRYREFQRLSPEERQRLRDASRRVSPEERKRLRETLRRLPLEEQHRLREAWKRATLSERARLLEELHQRREPATE